MGHDLKNLNVLPLNWESSFFKYSCGQILLKTGLDHPLAQLSETPYRLVVIKSSVEQPYLSKFLVDEKITFLKDVESGKVSTDGEIVTKRELTKNILSLALESGRDSRFFKDINFKSNEFETLYTQWIEKSLEGILADEVFVLGTYEEPKGLVTIKRSDTLAKIGLLAIHKDYQGKGLGKRLLEWCEEYCTLNGITELQVPTQRSNKNACHFYEKYGFGVENLEYVYHWWNE